jgi:hypothetical protein
LFCDAGRLHILVLPLDEELSSRRGENMRCGRLKGDALGKR